MVDLPTRLAPSSNTAYFSGYSFFHSNNLAYAFLLKYIRKEYVLQKRRNIFVDALELLGYLVQVEEGRYLLNMDLDSEALVFSAKKD